MSDSDERYVSQAQLIQTTRTVAASTTLLGTDSSNIVETNTTTANTVTVPTNATAPITNGTVVVIRQYGTGTTSVAGASGVTLRSRGGVLNLAGQYAEATLTKRDVNEWILSGDLA